MDPIIVYERQYSDPQLFNPLNTTSNIMTEEQGSCNDSRESTPESTIAGERRASDDSLPPGLEELQERCHIVAEAEEIFEQVTAKRLQLEESERQLAELKAKYDRLCGQSGCMCEVRTGVKEEKID